MARQSVGPGYAGSAADRRRRASEPCAGPPVACARSECKRRPCVSKLDSRVKPATQRRALAGSIRMPAYVRENRRWPGRKAGGSSRWARCPAPGISTSTAREMAVVMAAASPGGVTTSSAPTRIKVGQLDASELAAAVRAIPQGGRAPRALPRVAARRAGAPAIAFSSEAVGPSSLGSWASRYAGTPELRTSSMAWSRAARASTVSGPALVSASTRPSSRRPCLAAKARDT